MVEESYLFSDRNSRLSETVGEEIREYLMGIAEASPSYVEHFCRAMRAIFKTELSTKIFFYFAEYGLSTSKIIEHHTGASQPQIYKILQKFANLNLIQAHAPIKNGSRGKPATMYSMGTPTPPQVQRVISEDIKLREPIFYLVEKVADLIIREYVILNPIMVRRQGVHEDVIRGYLKKEVIPSGYSLISLTRLVCSELVDRNYKVVLR